MTKNKTIPKHRDGFISLSELHPKTKIMVSNLQAETLC